MLKKYIFCIFISIFFYNYLLKHFLNVHYIRHHPTAHGLKCINHGLKWTTVIVVVLMVVVVMVVYILFFHQPVGMCDDPLQASCRKEVAMLAAKGNFCYVVVEVHCHSNHLP